ncbi:hypothetical protein JCM5350_001262 [Sporobolomyces pararoseus]
MSDNKNVDLLSRLPPELIQNIFNEIEGRDKALTAPISKRLVHFQQLRLYRTVSLTSYTQLDKLCNTAQTNQCLLKSVQELKVDIGFEFDTQTTVGSNQVTEVQDPLIPSSQQIAKLFNKLERVESLDLLGSFRLASLLLSPDVSTSSLPNLSTLRLTSTFSDLDDPFHPSYYSNLTNYSALSKFFLRIFRDSLTIRPSTEPLPDLSPFRKPFLVISLGGPISSSHASAKCLLGSIGKPVMLELTDSSPSSRMYDLFDSFDCPEKVQYLALRQYRLQRSSTQESNLLKALSTFTSLDRLVLGESCAPLYSPFYSVLRSLPLKGLVFDSEADINLVELTKLISGRQKHLSLAEISFQNVRGKRGTKIEDMDNEPYTGEDGEGRGPYPDWELPKWTDGFNPVTLKEFLKVAEKEGIKVSGSALEALDIDEEFMEELYWLQPALRLREEYNNRG